MKVLINTMHAARNYGAVLQTYALQKYIENMGIDAEILDYRLPNQSTKGYLFNVNDKFKKNILMKTAYLIKTIVPKYITTKLFADFQKRKLKLTRPVELKNGQLINCPYADIYCSGSDQIWNPRANGGLNPAYFYNGVTGKKISYSSSIGVKELSDVEKMTIKKYLDKYDAVSIREISSISLLDSMNIKSECVLDPTLMLTPSEWDEFSNEEIGGEPYILVYYFGNSKYALEVAKEIAKGRGLKIRRIAVGFEKYGNDDIIERFVTPERFIALFRSSSYVITNSFHGTIFSINFSKQFLSYPTTENNARFDSVYKMFDLEERNLRNHSKDDVNCIPDIDYNTTLKILTDMRMHSESYLLSALRGES